jgi:hypothetical protein
VGWQANECRQLDITGRFHNGPKSEKKVRRKLNQSKQEAKVDGDFSKHA